MLPGVSERRLLGWQADVPAERHFLQRLLRMVGSCYGEATSRVRRLRLDEVHRDHLVDLQSRHLHDEPVSVAPNFRVFFGFKQADPPRSRSGG